MTTTEIADFKAFAQNIALARQDVGAGPGSGDAFLKIDDRNGAITFGKDAKPLPKDHVFIVGLHNIMHGWIDFKAGTRMMVPMHKQPARPTPPGGTYGTFEGGGPRKATELKLESFTEPGFHLVFTALNQSNENRVGNLLDDIIARIKIDKDAGFVHPAIVVQADRYMSKERMKEDGRLVPARWVYTFGYDIRDWMHHDGTLLNGGGEQLDDVTEAERALFKA